MLVHHVKYRGEYIGTVVAVDKDVVGWSQCCTKERRKEPCPGTIIDGIIDGKYTINYITIPADKFDKERGITIALGRAYNGTKSEPTHDRRGITMQIALEDMRQRSQKYYKVPPHEFEQKQIHLSEPNYWGSIKDLYYER